MRERHRLANVMIAVVAVIAAVWGISVLLGGLGIDIHWTK